MAYQRRGASFTFLDFTRAGRTVRVVEDEEETPALIRPPLPARRSVGGTVAVRAAEWRHVRLSDNRGA